ncbi:MAG: calcineurin-like phosphoesterase C-terminal domain-containing protein [Alistipes sp.]|nr:calcineurin-like phosphoesterase C-terminal domain-containing protein [Alistipes sp.]
MRRLVAILTLTILCIHTLQAEQSIVAPEGATVFGVVSCDGTPVEGVVVSDGALFTRTDSRGIYSLPSLKYYGSVFIITPSGYEPTTRRGINPQFWAPLSSDKPQKVERHDFSLKQVDNTRHRMIFTADMHISGRNDDMIFFKRLCMPALRRAAEQVRDSMPVYSITLGDLCRNDSWYSQDIDPKDVIGMLATMRYPTMLYTVMGENEYDAAIPAGIMTDHLASELYATTCAPRFYAINIGQVHYIILDNTLFRNDEGDGKYPTEVVGKRNYDRRVTADCMAWLRRDLELIEDKSTPIVVCMHHNVIRMSNKGRVIKALTKEEDTDSLIACFADFSDVRFVTAHAHRRRISAPKELKNIREHTVSSLSGNNWESLFNGYAHMCSDGSPAGFELFDYDGRNLRWQFRPVEEQPPLRMYDINTVGEYYRKDNNIQGMLRANADKRTAYNAANFENYVYINSWTDDPGSKLEVWENGKQLKPRRIYHDDPLYTVATAAVRYRNARGRKVNIGRNNAQHLYRVKADSANTTIHVRLTSPFGEIYTDSLTRPAPFLKPTRRR